MTGVTAAHIRLADLGSELAIAVLALVLVRLAAGRERTVVPALVVAALAAVDAFRPHAALAHALASVLPFDALAGVPVRRLAKVLVLVQVFGTAATLLIATTPAPIRRPLLLWLVVLAGGGALGELAGPLLAAARAPLALVEEMVELLASLAAAGRVMVLLTPAARAGRAAGAPLRP